MLIFASKSTEKYPDMKLLHILSMAAVVALVSCQSKTESSAEATADAADSAAAVTEAPAPAEAADAVAVIKPGEDPKAEAGKPVVIDFSAVWCGPCQQFKPVFHKVAGEYASKAAFYTADLDECTELASKYNVTSIPCIIILKEGAEPVSQVGAMDEAQFKALLDKSL